MIGKKFITQSGLKICVIGKTMKSNYCCIAIKQEGDFGLITLSAEELSKLKEIKNDN